MKLLLCCLCLLLTACRIDAAKIVQPGDLTVIYAGGAGKTTVQEKIGSGDAKYRQILNWFARNERGWSPSPASYGSTVEVRGNKFILQFSGKKAILNYEDADGGHHQYVKDVEEADYRFLMR